MFEDIVLLRHCMLIPTLRCTRFDKQREKAESVGTATQAKLFSKRLDQRTIKKGGIRFISYGKTTTGIY